jgi:hypothetical protein
MVDKIDEEIAIREESKVEKRKGQDSLNVETLLLEKLNEI